MEGAQALKSHRGGELPNRSDSLGQSYDQDENFQCGKASEMRIFFCYSSLYSLNQHTRDLLLLAFPEIAL